jgi:transposase
MEACSGAEHWVRLFQAHGRTVRFTAPKFVARISAATCEALTRLGMRFVALKNISSWCIAPARGSCSSARRSSVSPAGLLSDLSIVLPLKAAMVRREVLLQLEDRLAGPIPSMAIS